MTTISSVTMWSKMVDKLILVEGLLSNATANFILSIQLPKFGYLQFFIKITFYFPSLPVKSYY